ncbi:hypothetical protein [Mycobacteroides abscessus]|uniref:hypothetical protein n=1 Tax=Mycobacteroides abscessus TaxID=36809 RepID=UPI0005E148AD|nr:hypothetical protein [Mycobacteroides abscessus]CPW71601.1 Uncharacterised protein [Mycobacteroides abscessus]SKF62120.1 Uncharacterised protein [Mycobacteroides abscessus subsp. bolletii]SKH91651.1 Uncharacterised protein [Mycobacteroides abscessus subsp. bolletii]
MTSPDMPPVTTPHAAEIIRSNFPVTSESGTVESVIALFQRAAESVGTGNTAETMFALIEANATGEAPTALIGEFTADQRVAFDRALRSLNQGQGASVMAQDILNTKVQLNGTVVNFEAAVEELIASYAGSGGPSSPKNQAEFQQKYDELLQQAKDQADTLGKNHKSTQDQLVAGVQKGAAPEIPSTMAPTSSSNPSVPGMPDGALGSMLQNVAGQMIKPPNMQMPNIGQMAQPAVQSAQQAIQELMKGKGQGVPITEDALKKLTTSAGLTGQGASLSNARRADLPGADTGPGAHVGNPAGLGAKTMTNETGRHAAPNVPESETGPDGKPHNPPATPATTAAPAAVSPTTTASSGEAATGPDTLTPSAQTHASSGDAGTASSTLTQSGHTPVAATGAAPQVMPMGGMPSAGAAPAGGTVGSWAAAVAERSAGRVFRPDLRAPDDELRDLGTETRGLTHATDQQHIAASITAGLIRMHQRAGMLTNVAVGISASQAVFVTSDGLGFLSRGIKAQSNLTPLITVVPDSFVERWLGCDQPWRPLLDAAALGLVAPFDSVVSSDPSAAQQPDVLVLGAQELAEVNVLPGSQPRTEVDAIDTEDVDPVIEYLLRLWGAPRATATWLEEHTWQQRWSGEFGDPPRLHAWVHYLLAAAIVDKEVGDIDSARYMLRNALRVPVPAQVQR